MQTSSAAPYLLPPVLSALILIGLGVYAWRFREVPTALPFSLAMCLGAMWALAYALDVAAPSLAEKVFWMKVRFLAIAPLPVVWLVTAARYTGRDRWAGRRRVAALLLVPAVTVGLAWTAEAHTLFRYAFRLEASGPLVMLAYASGPWTYVHFFYSYALQVATFGLLAHSFSGAHPNYVRQTLLAMAAVLAPAGADLLFFFGLSPLRGYNPAPALFWVTGLAFAWALFRYRLLDVVPIARGLVVATMADPVLVVDARQRLVDYNPAARDRLGLDAAGARGRPLADALPAWPELLEHVRAGAARAEVSRGARTYELSVTPIAQEEAPSAGSLVLLRDVTERSQSEARLREERERLRQLLDLAPFPLVLTRLSDGTVQYLNQKAEALFGLPRAQVVGRPAPDFYFNPDDRARLIDEARRTGFIREQELQLKRADGEPFWALVSAALTTLDDQAVLFVGLTDITARRQAEQTERQQRVLAEALRDTAAALATTLDFDDVLERLLINIGRVAPHEAVNLALIGERGQVRIVQARGYPEPDLARALLSTEFSLEQSAHYRRMAATGQPVVVPDTAADPDWADLPAFRWVRSYAGLPIRLRGQVVGFLNLDSATPGLFTPAHVEALRAFADQAAAAIDNARLYEETRRRAEQLAALNRIGLAVTSGLDLDRVLRAVFEECRHLLPLDAFYIAVYDADAWRVEHPFLYDRGEYISSPARDIRRQPGLSGEVILSRQTLYLPDMLEPETARQHQIVRSEGEPTRSYVGAPMLIGDQVVGVISIQSYQPNAYTPDQIALLETIAPQAAIAVENARLYAAAQTELAERRQAEESLRQANDRLRVQLVTIEALQASLREQAIRDPLTGLFNRRYFEEAFDQELARAERDGHPVCLVLIDLDRFKTLNDAHGHQAGDAVLRALARLLQAQTRRSDIVCRYGGEEFLVALPTMTLSTAHQRAESWRQAFAALEIEADGRMLRATFSAGLAEFPDQGPNRAAVVAAADRALYAAKAAGRNRVVVGE